MKTQKSKKIARQEKKKEKLAALVAITKLNDKDRLKQAESMEAGSGAGSQGPSPKRIRKTSHQDHSDAADIQKSLSNLENDAENDSSLNAKDVKSLKEEYSNVKSRRKAFPKFRLKSSGENASLEVEAEERVPLMLTDVQHLMLHALLAEQSAYRPSRWYHLDKCSRISQTTCLVFEGVSLQHWQQHRTLFSFTDQLFESKVEVITPSVYDGSLVEELASVPLSDAEKECLVKKYGSMDLAMESRKDLMVMIKAVFPILASSEPENTSSGLEDKYPRTQLILSAWQLIEENYPLPLKGKLKNTYADYVMTKDVYRPATPQSPMFGLDCEMCLTSLGSELTRVSVVNEQHETIYETLVKPYNEIVNYLTQFSGITKSLLEGVTKRLEDVQKDLKDILPPDAILVGQSLNSDLHALKMMHPYIIDTSVIFNITGERTRKSKLKTLAYEFLQQNIQEGRRGHCSVEDSLASLKLVQLKLSKSMDYGDAVLAGRKMYEDNRSKVSKESTQYASTIFNHMIQQKKSSIIVGCEDITGDYHEYLTRANECSNSLLLSKKGKPKKVRLSTMDKHSEVIETVCQASKEHNFTMAHLKLDIHFEGGHSQIKQVDKWIEDIWTNLGQMAFFVVVFSGTKTGNGMALIQVKK